jgi:nucleotide-binding universal stress UspA family protein
MDHTAPSDAASHTPLSNARAAPRVLIAFGAERTPARLLREAGGFSLALGAELHVLRVIRQPGPDAPAWRDGAARARRLCATIRHACALCEAWSPESRLCVRVGDFVAQVAQHASELGADFIALSPSRKQLEATVRELAQQTGCAILVPRNCRTFSTLLAATDLEEPNTPLLRMAAELGRGLDATVVALHGVLDEAHRKPNAPSLEQSLLLLERATRSIGGRFESIVSRAREPARGILEQARRRNVDIIVVGARPRGSSHSSPGTAWRVVRRARRSVLVAPIGAPDGAQQAAHAS